jgi:hypothetical protein
MLNEIEVSVPVLSSRPPASSADREMNMLRNALHDPYGFDLNDDNNR